MHGQTGGSSVSAVLSVAVELPGSVAPSVVVDELLGSVAASVVVELPGSVAPTVAVALSVGVLVSVPSVIVALTVSVIPTVVSVPPAVHGPQPVIAPSTPPTNKQWRHRPPP
ncbi:hypothetical protein [Nannocystis pusilla]|uniref:Uncharacterized protein n=1 Tax=Nannocystis pusilla TaxID=889268 RepID=A0ABS7TP54_9BACT|nr:hypothetical protein [Nannocystis pusilla]MBZ5709946.1 hypothetical protein [Nannocystis pusilla]